MVRIRDDPDRSETQTWARKGQAGLSKREGLTQTKQQTCCFPLLSIEALDWKHLVSSGNSVCKRIYKLKIWPGKSLLKGASSSAARQSVSVLGNELKVLAYLILGIPELTINISMPSVWEIIHHYAQNPLCELRESMTQKKPRIYCSCNKNLNGLLQELLINLQFKTVDVIIAEEGRPGMQSVQ